MVFDACVRFQEISIAMDSGIHGETCSESMPLGSSFPGFYTKGYHYDEIIRVFPIDTARVKSYIFTGSIPELETVTLIY